MRAARSGFHLLAPLLGTIALAGSLPAQEPVSDSIPAYRLEGVTVTTTRETLRRAEVPRKVDVITSADIARSGATNVAELLRRTTPVEVIEYPGLLTGVAIRGFRPQFSGVTPRTLILVDGRPAGTNNLALVGVGDVERVEVLRGPASALYGSSAMGGVINVITRRGGGPLSGVASAGFGSFGTYQARGSVGGSVAPGVDVDVTISSLAQTAGYRTGSNRALSGDLARIPPGGTASPLQWASVDTVVSFTEFATRSGSGRVGYALAEGWRIEGRAEAFVGDNVQNPGDLTPGTWPSRSLKDVERGSLDVGVRGTLGSSSPSARVFSALETVDYYSAPEAPHFVSFRTPIRTLGAQVQDVHERGAVSLVTGADYTAIEAESERYTADGVRGAPFSPDAGIRSAAAFAQLRYRAAGDRLVLSTGARLDRVAFAIRETEGLANFVPNTESHGVFTPNLGARYALPGGVQLYGNVGGGFVTPEAFQVAGYSERRAGVGRGAVHVTRGNAGLRPESSRSWEGGVSYAPTTSGFDIDLALYRTDVTDRVISQPLPQGGALVRTAAGDSILSVTSYANVERAEIRGMEARVGYDFGVLRGFDRSIRAFLDGSRVFTAEEFPTGAADPRRIKNVADLTIVGGLDYDDFRRFDARLSGRYVGERIDLSYEDYVSEIVYPSYLVLDLTGAVRVAARYRVGAEVRNLLDEDYFEVRGYTQPGRALRFNLSVTF
jgi:vitamin B12 transporter